MSEFHFEGGALDGERWQERIHVPAELRYVEGHFPSDPIVPGVAQVVALAEERARHAWPELGASRGLRRLKFMSALRPGEHFVLALERKSSEGESKVSFRIDRDAEEAEKCSIGTLLFASSD